MTIAFVETSNAKYLEDGVPGDPTESVASGEGEDLETGLIAYLTQLGLGGDHLAKVMSLTRATLEEYPNQANQIPEPSQAPQPNHGRAAASEKTIRLHIAEEQLMLKESYQSFFT